MNGEQKKVVVFANVMLGGSGAICFAWAAYLIYRHGWSGHYLWLMLLGGAFCASFRLSFPQRMSLVLVLASGVISFSVADITLAILAVPPGRDQSTQYTVDHLIGSGPAYASTFQARARQNHIAYDTRSKYQVVSDLREHGIEAVPAIPPAIFVRPDSSSVTPVLMVDGQPLLPLAGISNKVTVLCNELGMWSIYQSDEHGFHNPQGIWNREDLDIAVLGDSFAQGVCVPSDRNFVALIRGRYPGTLTLGMGANGPLMELAGLKEYLSARKPKVVLWCY
jgi:hypothetical protein